MDTMINSTDWLALIDDMMNEFNECVEYWAAVDDNELSDLYDDCIHELNAIKYSPIMLRDEDYYELGMMSHIIEKTNVWEQVYTDILIPLKRITDHIKEDME